MVENNEQILKIKIEDGQLKMEASIEDLVWLFNNNPENFGYFTARVKEDAESQLDFATHLLEHLLDENYNNGNLSNWAVPFHEAFTEIMEGDYDFCNYQEEDEEEDDEEEDED